MENGERGLRDNRRDAFRNQRPASASSITGRDRFVERDGTRQLSAAEGIAQEKFKDNLHTMVERAHSPESRVPFNSLKAGTKCRGRIITVKE